MYAIDVHLVNFPTSKPDWVISKTCESEVNKLEKAPKQKNNITANPVPASVPIYTKFE